MTPAKEAKGCGDDQMMAGPGIHPGKSKQFFGL